MFNAQNVRNGIKLCYMNPHYHNLFFNFHQSGGPCSSRWFSTNPMLKFNMLFLSVCISTTSFLARLKKRFLKKYFQTSKQANEKFVRGSLH